MTSIASNAIDPSTGFPADVEDQLSEDELLGAGPVYGEPVLPGLLDIEPPF